MQKASSRLLKRNSPDSSAFDQYCSIRPWALGAGFKGHEQSKIRPALVLSPSAYNKKTDRMIACAVTSHTKGYPFEVVIAEKKVTGAILVDQIRSLDWRRRNARFIQKVSRDIFEEVEEKLEALLFC